MANQYDRYLNRLRNIKAQRPEMQIYERNTAMMAQPFNILNRKVAQMTQAGGASTAAQVAALTEGRNQWNQMQQQNYGQAIEVASQREAQLDMKIAEVQFAKDQYDEQKKAEKQAKKTAALRAGLQAAGMIIGTVVAPGAGTAIGASLGQAAGGFVGVDEKGRISAKPEDWDPEMIVEGLSSVAGALQMNANEQGTKNMAETISDNAGAINDYIMQNPDAAPAFMMQLNYIVQYGNYKDLQNLLSRSLNLEVIKRF